MHADDDLLARFRSSMLSEIERLVLKSEERMKKDQESIKQSILKIEKDQESGRKELKETM